MLRYKNKIVVVCLSIVCLAINCNFGNVTNLTDRFNNTSDKTFLNGTNNTHEYALKDEGIASLALWMLLLIIITPFI